MKFTLALLSGHESKIDLNICIHIGLHIHNTSITSHSNPSEHVPQMGCFLLYQP